VSGKRDYLQQAALFPERADYPPGFRYQPEFLSGDEERGLAGWIATLPLRPFEFRGFRGGRRVVYFGSRYDYSRQAIDMAAPVPDELMPVMVRAARWSGHAPDEIRQAMATDYAVGAPIGWHRDRPQFGDVIGISLLTPAPFRLRRPVNGKWERKTIMLAPRSIYLLTGEVRNAWQHSIAPLGTLRYSITLRTLDADFARRLEQQQTAA
jgi:alkylated DNA repair dioxygenase AlkB